jgi:hypothetical protein
LVTGEYCGPDYSVVLISFDFFVMGRLNVVILGIKKQEYIFLSSGCGQDHPGG